VTTVRYVHPLFKTGSIKDKPRSGRPSKREEHCAQVPASVRRLPQKSLLGRSSELRSNNVKSNENGPWAERVLTSLQPQTQQ
jgi:hypothetical protein